MSETFRELLQRLTTVSTTPSNGPAPGVSSDDVDSSHDLSPDAVVNDDPQPSDPAGQSLLNVDDGAPLAPFDHGDVPGPARDSSGHFAPAIEIDSTFPDEPSRSESASDGQPSAARNDDSPTGDRLGNAIAAFDGQLLSGERPEARVLDRLEDLLRRALASQADLARFAERLDQLEMAHVLRGRL